MTLGACTELSSDTCRRHTQYSYARTPVSTLGSVSYVWVKHPARCVPNKTYARVQYLTLSTCNILSLSSAHAVTLLQLTFVLQSSRMARTTNTSITPIHHDFHNKNMFQVIDQLPVPLTLSSLSHFSSSCFRPCCSTGRHSSSDSYLLSCPWSSKIPKYASNGDVWPCCAGTCWNLWIVWGVRSIPCNVQQHHESTDN